MKRVYDGILLVSGAILLVSGKIEIGELNENLEVGDPCE